VRFVRPGLELGALWASPDVILRVEAPEVSQRQGRHRPHAPVAVGLNRYLMSGGPAEVYLIPFLAYVVYGDLKRRRIHRQYQGR
jgi:hypothetical protein